MRATLVSFAALVLGAHGCFPSPPGTTYKFAPGRLFPSAPDDGGYFGPTMDSGAKCCAKCESFKNCSFFTYRCDAAAAAAAAASVGVCTVTPLSPKQPFPSS